MKKRKKDVIVVVLNKTGRTYTFYEKEKTKDVIVVLNKTYTFYEKEKTKESSTKSKEKEKRVVPPLGKS